MKFRGRCAICPLALRVVNPQGKVMDNCVRWNLSLWKWNIA